MYFFNVLSPFSRYSPGKKVNKKMCGACSYFAGRIISRMGKGKHTKDKRTGNSTPAPATPAAAVVPAKKGKSSGKAGRKAAQAFLEKKKRSINNVWSFA